VTPIRPTGYPTPPAPNPAADAARLAAQRAFFDQALGRAAGAPATQATAAVQAPAAAPAAPAPVVRTVQVQAPAESPAKLLRPGSLLDIRVRVAAQLFLSLCNN
jgi:hypothetical protein